MRLWITKKDSTYLTWHLHGTPLSALLPHRIQFCLLCLPKCCPIKRPRQFLYSTSESNTQTEKSPIPYTYNKIGLKFVSINQDPYQCKLFISIATLCQESTKVLDTPSVSNHNNLEINIMKILQSKGN